LLTSYYGFSVGDLVEILQDIEWENIVAKQGELGMVIEIYEPDHETIFFDVNIQLGDGSRIPVWAGEIIKLEDK
jgi:hypothetical protein